MVVKEGLVVNSRRLIIIPFPFFKENKIRGADFTLTQKVNISHFFFMGVFGAFL